MVTLYPTITNLVTHIKRFSAMQTTTNTPKSNKNTPKKKTPQKGQGTPKSNKKQKLDENKSKEINTHSPDGQNENVKGISGDDSRVRVELPNREGVDYNEIQKIFKGCKQAFIMRPIYIEYDPSVASQKLEELRKIKINGIPLRIFSQFDRVVSHKRIIKLNDEKEIEAAKKFFDVESVEKLISAAGRHSGNYVITFKTKEDAETASEKMFEIDNKVCKLRPYFDLSRVVKARPEEKKSNEAERKLKQQKRKANENDEEADENEDDNCDNTTEGIEMDDDNDE